MIKKKYRDPMRAAVIRAIHTFANSDKRWERRRKTGLGDAELTEALRDELGIVGGGSLPQPYSQYFFWHKGSPPTVILQDNSWNDLATISGMQLVNYVRELGQIPYPGQGIPQDIFTATEAAR